MEIDEYLTNARAWFVGKRENFGTNGWDTLVGRKNVGVSRVEGASELAPMFVWSSKSMTLTMPTLQTMRPLCTSRMPMSSAGFCEKLSIKSQRWRSVEKSSMRDLLTLYSHHDSSFALLESSQSSLLQKSMSSFMVSDSVCSGAAGEIIVCAASSRWRCSMISFRVSCWKYRGPWKRINPKIMGQEWKITLPALLCDAVRR